jgi:hypothetical protein
MPHALHHSLTLTSAPRLGRAALPGHDCVRSTEAHNKHITKRQAQRQISDVYGGDGYDSPDEVSYHVPGDPFHRLPDDMPFAQYFYSVRTDSPGVSP